MNVGEKCHAGARTFIQICEQFCSAYDKYDQALCIWIVVGARKSIYYPPPTLCHHYTVVDGLGPFVTKEQQDRFLEYSLQDPTGNLCKMRH